METSDSECFESADEDFFSSDETERENEKSKDITPEVEKLQYLNINEERERSNTVEKSGNVNHKEEKSVRDDTTCNKKIGKTCHDEEVEGITHIEKQSMESMLDKENKNLPENKSIICKPNVHNNGSSSDSLNNSIDVLAQKDKEKYICDSNENEDKEGQDSGHDSNTSKKPENKSIKLSMKQQQEVEQETLKNNITNKDITNTDTLTVDTCIKCDVESESNMWEDDGWDIDNEDVKDICIQNVSSNQAEHTNSTSTPEIEQRDIKTLDEHLKLQQLTSDTQKLNIKSKLLEEENEDLANMWDNDDWEPLEEINDQPEEPQKMEFKTKESKSQTDAWSSWGSWGVSSILTTASTLTNHVSQGLNTIVDTSLGIPDPQELARLHKREEEELQAKISENKEEAANNAGTIGFGLGNLGNLVSGVSNITKFVEQTGNKVISGGLDTLETIGKKTMEVLQEGDPGLKKKRQFLKLEQEKPILSQVLREAKEKADQENQSYQQKHIAKKKNYETLFDDHHGLVHLEALEMLSKQCDIKLKTLAETCDDEKALTDLQETLEQVKELCELPDEDEEEQSTMEEVKEKLQSAVKELNINISYDRLLSTWEETETWLNNVNVNVSDENELHQQALKCLHNLLL
ncbi:unnamed protein product [Callosobruchus maculatus]|uniref:Protein FAM114A2 n=1 Tax=Callosobruchus maculatus TaxID=64391 RepID=A0A653BHN8_CALMS|nr:unnamed protein product [Callosobruchus maculatus]